MLTGSGPVTVGGSDASAGNTITGNAVGVKLASSSGNTVAFNTITGNAAQGVIVSNGKGDKISSNSISANLGLGIDLDTTAGTIPSNDQIAAPVLLSVSGELDVEDRQRASSSATRTRPDTRSSCSPTP